MGLEARCMARYGNQTSEGQAFLEPNELRFSGDFRLAIPFADIQRYEAKRGELVVTFPAGDLTLDLGRQAEKWALRIRYPNPLIDKLGVKAGARVGVVGVTHADFLEQLRERTSEVALEPRPGDCDAIFVLVERKEALDAVGPMQELIKRNGAIWVVYPKGRKEIREMDVIEYGKSAGLVDIKVVSFSDTHTALKLVIPVALR